MVHRRGPSSSASLQVLGVADRLAGWSVEKKKHSFQTFCSKGCLKDVCFKGLCVCGGAL